MKIMCASIQTCLGQIEKNTQTILDTIALCKNENCDYLVLPPLSLTGVSCQSLFDFGFFIERQNNALMDIVSSMPSDINVVTSIMENGVEKAVCFNNSGIVNSEFNICLSQKDIKENATNILLIKHKWTIGSVDELIYSLQGTTTYVCSCGEGESTSTCVYSGICAKVDKDAYNMAQFTNVIFDENTKMETLQKPNVFPNPQLPFIPEEDKYLDEGISILSRGLQRRLSHIRTNKMVIGVSGGLDSTLALLVAYHISKDKKDVTGITMPGFGTSNRTKSNADILMEKMCITAKTISIVPACTQHFLDIDQASDDYSITYENAQARERMQILFDYSNKIGALNVGTGDLSEAMLGFTTYGGDHMSMYALNANVPKTLVRALVKHFAKIYPELRDVLLDIVDTPISPELIPGVQKTESILGSYLYNDFAIYHTVMNKLSKAELLDLMDKTFNGHTFDSDKFYNRIFNAQFKRNCQPDGIQVIMFSVAPNGDFAFASDCKNIF